nr:mucin-5AC-like isoform X1 [Aedes albopictus]
MMLKLLIAACLVTHGLGRPDVSHLLKRENQRQNDRAFHPLEYLSRQLGNGGEFEARAATASEYNVFNYLTAFNETEINGLEGRSSSSSGSGRRAGGRAFRNVVKPSPFKKNAAEFGYTYDKPADPFDFPIHPDANLIKPVSTQAPEYLPPVSQSPQGPVDEQSADSGLPSSSPYPGSVPDVIATEGPQGPSGSTDAPESGFSNPVSSERPSTPDSTPSPSMSQSPQDGYKPQGPTSKPEDLNPGYPQGSTDDDTFTGYPLASSPRPVPSSSSSADVPQQPESQVTTESTFTGYPQGPSSSSYQPSPESTPGSSISSTDYPQTSTGSSLPDQRPSTEQEFTGYPQGPSSTASPDQGFTTQASPSSTVLPQGPNQLPEAVFTGYSQGPSSTVSPSDVPTTTEEQFTGYPQGPSSPSTTTDSPATGSTPALLTTEGTESDKPILPPNLNEVLGEPFDINDLATTTQPTTTTTRKTADGAFIPPKPRPELVVPNEPSTSQTPEQTEQPATPSMATSTPAASPGNVPSTSAPEYLPPEGDIAQKPSSGAPTGDVGESSTAAGYPSYSPETTTFAGYPSSDRETTTTSRYPVVDQDPSQETTTFGGYPAADQESTPGFGYPSSDRETTTTVKYLEPEQESLPGSGYPSSDRDSTTSTSSPSAGVETSPSSGYPSSDSDSTTPGYPEPARETTAASGLPSVSQETTTTSQYPSEESGPAEQETTTSGGYTNAQGSTTTVAPEYTTVSGATIPAPTTAQEYSPDQPSGPTSTAAPEYLPPEDANSTDQYYPPAANATAEFPSSPSTSAPEYRPEQPVRPTIPSDNLFNQTVPASPDYPSTPPPQQPETPVNIMDIISEINGMVPDSRPNNGYLPPNQQNTMDLRIVVDDTTPSGPSSRSPVPESEADGSELQPRVAPVESANGGYNYQVPDQRLPTPVIPSHTLDDEGYHYRIPKVPFLT